MPGEPFEPLTPEQQRALRQKASERIVETAEQLMQLRRERESRQGGPPTGEVSAQEGLGWRLPWGSSQRLHAEASLLEEFIELSLPESHLLSSPLRDSLLAREGEDASALEALFGGLAARQRPSEWLDQPAVCLGREQTFPGTALPGSVAGTQVGDSGAVIIRGYWLLLDGRLVETHELGTWRMGEEARLETRGQTLVGTRVVKAVDVVSGAGGLALPLELLRTRLHLFEEDPELAGRHVPDLAERQARFDALLEEYLALLQTELEALKRLGDSPA